MLTYIILGTNRTELIGDLYRLEMEKRSEMVCTDQEWLETSMKFFQSAQTSLQIMQLKSLESKKT